MATYVPNATEVSQPTGDKMVASAAPEFRTLKNYIQNVILPQLGDFNTELGAFQDQIDAILAAITVGTDSVALAATLASSSGSTHVGFLQSGANSITRTLQDKGREIVSVLDKGANRNGNPSSNSTAAFLNAYTDVYNAGGGAVLVPQGEYFVDNLPFTYGTARTVNFIGQGSGGTIIRQRPGVVDPLLQISATGVADIYSVFSGMRLVGNDYLGSGLQVVNAANFWLHDLILNEFDIGLDNRGSLVFGGSQIVSENNNTNYKSQKANGVYCNLIKFLRSRFSSAQVYALDLNHTMDLNFDNVSVENNGQIDDLTTGGVMIRAAAGEETGFSSISFTNNTHIENNRGWAFITETVPGLHLSHDGTTFLGNNSGKDMKVTGASISLKQVLAPSPTAQIELNGACSIVEGGNIATLVDNCMDFVHMNVRGAVSQSGVESNVLRTFGELRFPQGGKFAGMGATTLNAAMATFRDSGNSLDETIMYQTNGGTGNAAGCGFRTGRNSTTSRSINVQGTVNASGADYAEYMTKANGCGELVAGAVVGITADNELTDKWDQAVDFCIKSTDPSYVGNDTWSKDAQGNQITDPDALEAARQRVDRIAFSGVVPVLVSGAAAGKYVIATQGANNSITAGLSDIRTNRTVGKVRKVVSSSKAIVAVIQS